MIALSINSLASASVIGNDQITLFNSNHFYARSESLGYFTGCIVCLVFLMNEDSVIIR